MFKRPLSLSACHSRFDFFSISMYDEITVNWPVQSKNRSVQLNRKCYGIKGIISIKYENVQADHPGIYLDIEETSEYLLGNQATYLHTDLVLNLKDIKL